MLIGLTTWAQEKATAPKFATLSTEEKVDFQVKKLTKDLDLNEKQAADVKVLVTKEVEKREAKRADMMAKKEMNAQKREEAKAKMEKEQDAVRTEMKKILTPEQFTKWEQIRDERKAEIKEKMAERREKKAMTAAPEVK